MGGVGGTRRYSGIYAKHYISMLIKQQAKHNDQFTLPAGIGPWATDDIQDYIVEKIVTSPSINYRRPKAQRSKVKSLDDLSRREMIKTPLIPQTNITQKAPKPSRLFESRSFCMDKLISEPDFKKIDKIEFPKLTEFQTIPVEKV
jgi:hypothetical protein